MSFRGRLFIFFTIIVVVPMAAVAVVLFRITSDSETGKSDARIAQGLTTALSIYQADVDRARVGLQGIAHDAAMSRALAHGDQGAVRLRARQLVARRGDIASIAYYAPNGRRVAYTSRAAALAYATAEPTTASGRRVGTFAVSTTAALDYVRSVQRLTGLQTVVLSGAQVLASTLAKTPADLHSGDLTIGGEDYRARFQTIETAPLPGISVGITDRVDSSSITAGRLLIGGILFAFLILALASSVLVVRALQGQVGSFLEAARRLGSGNFDEPVPIHGSDEFAALGTEFNNMSNELADHIAELERKRLELELAIRRVGEAVGAGLDREGVVALVVRTAI
jgi:methyl-accepting chemotaxis protein